MARIDGLTKRSVTSRSALARRRARTPKGQSDTTPKENGQVVDLIASDTTPIIDIITANRQMNHFRRGELTHVSDIIGKCNRMIAIHYKHDMPIHAEPLHPSMAMTFSIGEGIHDFVTNRVQTNAPDNAYGRFSCACGRSMHQTTFAGARALDNAECCDTPHTKYHELLLPNEKLGMIGSADLTLMLSGALYITEIKSMAKSMFADLERPVPEHVIQVLFYWKFAHELGYQIHDKVSIIYCQKEFMFSGVPFKEFVIKPAEHIHRLNDYIEYAEELKSAREGGALPPRICANQESKVAAKCPMKTTCFGLSD